MGVGMLKKALVLFSVMLGAGMMAGCATYPSLATTQALKPFVLENYFAGISTAQGRFTNSITGQVRGMSVALQGFWDGRTLKLVEDFTFDDGEKDRKIWFFEKIAPDRYIGRRDDVVGVAEAQVVGQELRLTYQADVPTAQGSIRLTFHDTLALQGNGVLLNRAVVSKFGIPIGRVDLEFRRLNRKG